jgi:hypothetical protein
MKILPVRMALVKQVFPGASHFLFLNAEKILAS